MRIAYHLTHFIHSCKLNNNDNDDDDNNNNHHHQCRQCQKTICVLTIWMIDDRFPGEKSLPLPCYSHIKVPGGAVPGNRDAAAATRKNFGGNKAM